MQGPWFRRQTWSWYVEVAGTQHRLGRHPSAEAPRKGRRGWSPPPEIQRAWLETVKPVAGGVSVDVARSDTGPTIREVIQAFLDAMKGEMADSTREWYAVFLNRVVLELWPCTLGGAPGGAPMIRYAMLHLTPKMFPALTGLTLAEFERLAEEFAAARARQRAASTHTKKGTPRRRAAGAGAPPTLAPADRLLMALFWLRIYPTYEVLGFFFGLEKSNAWENVQDALAVLATLADFPFERPAADRPKLATPQAVFAAFPEVKVVIDGKEQAFRRPGGWDEQKPFYSGKWTDIAPRSLGKEDETRTQKPFIGTLWVNESHPAELGQQPEASLAWGQATATAKRRQRVPRPCD